MITTVNDGWELYVYYQGILIYKRWLQRDTDMVFHRGEGLSHRLRWPHGFIANMCKGEG